MHYFLVKVTRLIRVSYGDYNLQTIPPGMAIEVPIKSLETQKRKGNLWTNKYAQRSFKKEQSTDNDTKAIPIQWVRNL